MNKVITINLNGNAYQLEEGGFELLRAYLDGAARRLEGNPDRDEIIADIEQSIADKCRAVLGAGKTVVITREVGQIIDEMGPVENAAAESDGPAAGPGAGRPDPAGAARPAGSAAEAAEGASVRRLYKIPEGAMLFGVCNGLAAFSNVDVTLVRIAFALGTLCWGAGILVYAVLVFLLPTAGTTAEKAAAYGMPSTAREFIHRARQGYYDGLKSLSDKQAHREWRRRFRHELRGWRRMFRHEMHAKAYQGEHNWSQRWAHPFPPDHGSWLALPFVSLMRGGLVLLFLYVLVSLLAHGVVYGLALPAGVPVWAAIMMLIVAYGFVTWPFKAMRRAYYYSAGAGAHWTSPFVWAFDALIGVGFVVLVVWLAAGHWPEVREALTAIPPTVHQGADAIRAWWAKP